MAVRLIIDQIFHALSSSELASRDLSTYDVRVDCTDLHRLLTRTIIFRPPGVTDQLSLLLYATRRSVRLRFACLVVQRYH